MQLRCQYCQAVQPVNTADAEDEDPRTQVIRRAFRDEHLPCGERAVSLEMAADGAIEIDTTTWDTYLASLNGPADVLLGGDGSFFRTIQRDGVSHNVRVCEDCWQNIPRYVDFPFGLTSPESDGDHVAIPKLKSATVETADPNRSQALVHLSKAVCLPCYLAAFRRVYPEASPPPLREDVVGDGAPIEPPPALPAEELGRVTLSRWDVPA